MIELRLLQQIFLLVIAVVAISLCYVIVQPFVWPFLAAAALTILFYPAHLRIVRLVKRRDSLAAFLSIFLILFLILGPAFWLVSTVTKEVAHLYSTVQNRSQQTGGWQEWVMSIVEKPLDKAGVNGPEVEQRMREFISDRVDALNKSIGGILRGILSNVTAFLANAVISLFILFFLLRDGDRLLLRARGFLPIDPVIFDRIITEVGQSVLANLYGVGAVALVQGLLTGLLFFFTGIQSPVLWGVVAGFCSMIPVVGPPAVWGPAALVLALQGSYSKAIIVAAIGAGVIGTVDNVMRPWIISGRVQLHPLLVFISLLGGAQAYGFLGLFIGPAILSVTIVILEALKYGLPRLGRDPELTSNRVSLT